MKQDDERPAEHARQNVTRRHALGAFAAASALPWLGDAGASQRAGGTAAAAPAANWTSTFVSLPPAEQFRQVMRIQRSLEDTDDILHWYHFIMFVVPDGASPKPVVRWEGIELSRHERIGPDRYRLHGHNLSFPRHLGTGEFVDEITNPVTGRPVRVPTMALTADPGLVRSPAGTITLDRPDAPPRQDYRVLRREGDRVKVDAIRVPPETWPKPFVEMGYESAPAALFDDPTNRWLPTEVSGAYVFPWPAWLQMGDAPGHMFAAWSGYKLRNVGELPDEFRKRAERERPDLLQVDRAPFAKPLPAALRG